MNSLVVIIPSRGRPHAIRDIIDQYNSTSTAATTLYFSLDTTDPTLTEYKEAVADRYGVGVVYADNHSMVEALNNAAKVIISNHSPFAVMFAGDDHRPRTLGWDTAYLAMLKELGTGMVYGDDAFQGPNIPTQIAMTADIVKALGYMAYPEFTHLYVDNWWKELGQGADCIRYLPNIVIEHMHPAAYKAPNDEHYARVNADSVAEHDFDVLNQWRNTLQAEHITKILELKDGQNRVSNRK